jgi:hypothetical protein
MIVDAAFENRVTSIASARMKIPLFVILPRLPMVARFLCISRKVNTTATSIIRILITGVNSRLSLNTNAPSREVPIIVVVLDSMVTIDTLTTLYDKILITDTATISANIREYIAVTRLICSLNPLEIKKNIQATVPLAI